MKKKYNDNITIYDRNNLKEILEAKRIWDTSERERAINNGLYGVLGDGYKFTAGGLKRYRSKPCTYKYYLKAFKTYSKRKLKTFRKRRNYKKTKRGKY
jgi:hypothetical protein